MLANDSLRISIMTHQLLFAKNITQIAHRIKLLQSDLRWNFSSFLGNIIALDNDGSTRRVFHSLVSEMSEGTSFCVQASIRAY